MSSQPFRVLIIGCGNIAGGFDAHRPQDALPLGHAKAYLHHGGFALVACVEPDATKRDAFQRRWGIPVGVNAISSLPQPLGFFDVISICSSTNSHAADLEAALALQPRLIFCEKPVTPDLVLTRYWVQRCTEQNVLLAVNYTRRWAPDISRFRDEIVSGQWGEIRSIVGHYNKGVLNNGSHMFDLLHYLFGELSIETVGAPLHDFFADDPSVPATLRSKKGVPIAINISHARDYALFELQVITAKAVISMENGGLNWRIRQVSDSPLFEGYRTLDDGRFVSGEITLAMTDAIKNIYQALTSNEELASTGSSSLQAQQISEQISRRAEGTIIST
jgi:predicted dehydrogenase